MDDAPVLALSTAPNADVAARLARALVDRRLAACVNVIDGVRSFYRWQGEVEDEAELQLLIKTRWSHLEGIEELLADEHPYDVPELLVLPIQGGADRYLEWLKASTAPRGAPVPVR
ncbi:MAG: divalent-cation tolerance protein CutA [Sandaracinaceae bacterium]